MAVMPFHPGNGARLQRTILDPAAGKEPEESPMELIEMLTSQLRVSDEQAKGGSGLLLQLAKEKLGEDDFDQIARPVPHAPGMAARLHEIAWGLPVP